MNRFYTHATKLTATKVTSCDTKRRIKYIGHYETEGCIFNALRNLYLGTSQVNELEEVEKNLFWIQIIGGFSAISFYNFIISITHIHLSLII